MPITRRRHSSRIRLAAAALCLLVAALSEAAERPLTLDAIFSSDDFANPLPSSLRWRDDSTAITYIDANSGALQSRPADGGEPTTLLAAPSLQDGSKALTATAATWSPDLTYALIETDARTSWDGHTEGVYYVYNRKTGDLRALAGGAVVRYAELAPNGQHVVYVLNNNLYLADTRGGEPVAITRDGGEHVFNGVFDYGSSEFGQRKAWHWSPDSAQIAFWRLDATDVPTYPLIDELGKYSEVRRFHYPNTGERHAINRIGIYRIGDGSTRWLDTAHDPDDYLPRVDWDDTGRYLFVQHLTRNHKQLRLLRFDLEQGDHTVALTDTDPAWIDITDDFTALPGDSGEFLWTSERSGYRHIYRYQDGKLLPLTSGEWSVDAIIGLSTTEATVYFYAKKDSLVDQHVYRVPLSGGEVTRVTEPAGWHQWQLSPNGQYAVATHSTANRPQVVRLRNLASGNSVPLANKPVAGMLDYALPQTEFIQFKTDDGVTLNGYFIKPLDFDPNKQYPVIAYAYGNAGSQIVVNRWGTQRGASQDLWHRYMAQQGYVIFAMDNRTTTGRGKAAKNLTYGHYGKYAVLDELQGVAYLKTLPWVDPTRIGFWGWSGGGYLAAALMTKGAPHFKAAVSVAPVIDLTRYQAVGVERWMGTPQDNPEGYAAVNLMNYADRLQGKLLLMHGTGDENVKFAFTLQFVDALIAADKQFDMVVYPNQRHTIAGARKHVFSTMTRYFEQNL
ncbi:S9 family peptidase [Parahaliea mediterranea]|uniref:S9 family peptidase n=1 Tax=Parahaliea mediterranea TaxID=651086 RepID=UPI000E2E5F67|nr:S9 family peptidase [Parahaliea mediterranea]